MPTSFGLMEFARKGFDAVVGSVVNLCPCLLLSSLPNCTSNLDSVSVFLPECKSHSSVQKTKKNAIEWNKISFPRSA
jgi:hypothetical protein